MSVFKCKMCGGTIEVTPNLTTATCEYCGSLQTLPRMDSDRLERLYDRANHFRRSNEFDKAIGIYEQILAENGDDAEAYWSLVLCRYGIEYVEDPKTHKRIPTVNRVQYTSVFDDDNYKSALTYADEYQRHIYEEEAKTINEIQKGILAISQKEEPFDVFICYKETDEYGRRTHDSVYANELYHELTECGLKVFFSRITLEDKLGTAYEPYIFAALNSAKVMVVLGTKPEYFNAVWVRNEWSRYLSLIKNGEKKVLIPAYRDMDPYDLPDEFSHLQAQDMNKLGFMTDLIRGIRKILGANVTPVTKKSEKNASVSQNSIPRGGSVDTYLRRVAIFLEGGDFKSADAYCERVLDIDPENVMAYVYKILSELHVSSIEDLNNACTDIENMSAYKNALRFADDNTVRVLLDANNNIKENIKEIENERIERERFERQARELENELRQRRNSLMQSRQQVADRIFDKTEEAEELQDEISKKQKNANIFANPKKVVKNAVKILVVALVGLISMIVSINSENLDVVGVSGCIFSASIILYFVFGVTFLKACGKSGWLVTINLVTYGLYSLIYALNALISKGGVKNIRRSEKEISDLKYRLSIIQSDIDSHNRTLDSINQQLKELEQP